LEFQKAAHSSTLPTAPLPLYYAFLSLMRGLLAMLPDGMPTSAHGLKFDRQENILSCSAKMTKGTFTDYLDSRRIPWQAGDSITLSNALGCIPELYNDSVDVDGCDRYCQLVWVKAVMRGPVRLHFAHYSTNFSSEWTQEFPGLASLCKQFGSDPVLEVNDSTLGHDPTKIATLLHENLWHHLTPSENAKWSLLRTTMWPRSY
jgi:hypothetical protein